MKTKWKSHLPAIMNAAIALGIRLQFQHKTQQ